MLACQGLLNMLTLKWSEQTAKWAQLHAVYSCRSWPTPLSTYMDELLATSMQTCHCIMHTNARCAASLSSLNAHRDMLGDGVCGITISLDPTLVVSAAGNTVKWKAAANGCGTCGHC
jgi:hypothetical protein